MELTQVQKLQFNKLVDKILNTTGNYNRSKQLEMTFVFDECSSLSYGREMASELASSLKAHDKIFQNVRCNMLHWRSDASFENEILPLSFLQMKRICWEENGVREPKRCIEDMFCYLKKFHARSKCIILLTEKDYPIEDIERAIEGLSPFLKMKLLIVRPEEFVVGSMLFARLFMGR